MRNFMMFALLALAPEAMAVKAPSAPVPATSVTPTATQWFVDEDGDGYRSTKVVGVGPTAPKGGRPASAYHDTVDCNDDFAAIHPGATEESAVDRINQDCGIGETPETEAPGAKARSLASWSIYRTVAMGPSDPAYPKVVGQVEACLGFGKDWADSTCECGDGERWYSFQVEESGLWSGACNEDDGASVRHSGGGVDSKARKDTADLRMEFEADQAADEAAHEGLRSTDVELRADIDANYEADIRAWEQYRIQREADIRAKERFEAELAEIEAEQDAGIKDAQIAADRAQAAIGGETQLREEADKVVLKEAHRFSFGLTAGGMLGGNTEVRWTEADLVDEDTGEVVEEGDKYLLRGANSVGGMFDVRLGYRFWNHANLGVGLTATAIRETTQFKAGRSVGVTGFDQIGRVTALYEPDLEKILLGFGGGAGYSNSSTAMGAAQCKVFGRAPVLVGEFVASGKTRPLGLRLLIWGGPEKVGFTPEGDQNEHQYDGATLGAALGLTVSR